MIAKIVVDCYAVQCYNEIAFRLKIQHKNAGLMLIDVEYSTKKWYNIVESSFHNETEDCYEMPSEIERTCSAAWRSVHE